MLVRMRSNAALRDWLDRCTTMIEDSENNKAHLLGPMANRIKRMADQLEVAVGDSETTFALRRDAVNTSQQKLAHLMVHCNDARSALLRQFKREKLTFKVQERFGFRTERPKRPGDRGWLRVAKDLIKGDTAAKEAGFELNMFPNTEMLQALREEARLACKAADEAMIQHKETANKLRECNTEIRELALDTVAWFRFSLRRGDPAETRLIMERFGFRFNDRNGEDVEITGNEEPSGEGEQSGGSEPPAGSEPQEGSQQPEPNNGQTGGSGTPEPPEANLESTASKRRSLFTTPDVLRQRTIPGSPPRAVEPEAVESTTAASTGAESTKVASTTVASTTVESTRAESTGAESTRVESTRIEPLEPELFTDEVPAPQPEARTKTTPSNQPNATAEPTAAEPAAADEDPFTVNIDDRIAAFEVEGGEAFN